MGSPFRIELAREEDIPEMMSILVPAFENFPSEELLGNVSTPEGLRAAGERHAHAWRQHALESSMPCAIMCVQTHPQTERETIVGAAEWFIYDRPRSPEQYRQAHSLLSASWVPEDGGLQAKARASLQPVTDARIRWMGGRPYAVLMYMCVKKEFRRMGISTMCVKWGLEKCKELNIPAYLEASEDGAPVYRRLGFVDVDTIRTELDGEVTEFPAMIWWPPGTKEEDMKPAEQ